MKRSAILTTVVLALFLALLSPLGVAQRGGMHSVEAQGPGSPFAQAAWDTASTASAEGVLGFYGRLYAPLTKSTSAPAATPAATPAAATATRPPTPTIMPVPTKTPTSLEVRVAAKSDDAEESAAGNVSFTSTDLELVYDGSNQTVGLRFAGVSIPQGATIVNAYVQFQVDEATTAATALTIRGQATDNAPTFSAATRSISSRTRTAAAVFWSPAPWPTVGADQRTPSLTRVIQEIVSRTGWSSGNALAIIITGTGVRVATAYDGAAAAAPLLHVEYRQNRTSTTSVDFISWGDSQGSGTYLQVTSKQAASLHPAFTIFNGDFEYKGFRQEEMDLMVSALNGDTSGNTSNGLFNKTFLVRGNHDNVYSNPAEWQDYLAEANRPPVPGVGNYTGMEANTTYLSYFFDYENARFIGLDVPGGVSYISTAQITWLDEILTEAETDHPELVHAFIFFHGPIYCIESVYCSCSAMKDPACIPSKVTSLISVFNRHPIVSATFHGHEHDFAWTHIDGERITGVTHEFEQFVTSPAGGGPYDRWLYPQRVDYAAMINSRGFAAVDVSGTEFTVSFYRNGTPSPIWSRTFSKSGSSATPSATHQGHSGRPTRR